MFGVLQKVFGSKNDREINRIKKKVLLINSMEDEMKKLSDDELKAKTVEFKSKLENGSTLDDILVEAFAVVRETSIRVLGMRHYDVQLIGGIVLHEGKITEMKTGEGKTLVATLAVYLNALTGKGVHVITVNDYLATRDMEWMGKIYRFLGLSVGVVVNGIDPVRRKAAYNSDIVYGTNNEFGFDYLRDNMVVSGEERVQRELNFTIIDEVDSILIDEARTPLIISGPSETTTKWYGEFSGISKQLVRSVKTEGIKRGRDVVIDPEWFEDYEVDEKASNITITEKGIKKVEQILKIDNLYSPQNVELTHYLMQALKAKELFKKDKDYIVKDGEVIIVDEFTGRLMSGRRYSDGLHQAIEAKEGVNVAGENQTLASVTLQNYFRMYNKLAGMTGTAETEASEFMHIYKLPVVVIPTNKPIARKDMADLIYRSRREKINAIVKDVVECYKKGQPTLVGTISIEGSEQLSSMLKAANIPHSVLNAKYHEQEADIVSQAGRKGAVTIATNMAGRGTDIVLGGNPEFLAKQEVGENAENYQEVLVKYEKLCKAEKDDVLSIGGLNIIGTERHESRRIDNQLRGRAGRQGDPGSTAFYISLEDDLMRLFGSERVQAMMDRLGIEEGEVIQNGLISRSIAGAQKRVEGRNFSIRKSLLEYDDVMNQQREVIYKQRNRIIDSEDIKEDILKMLSAIVSMETVSKLVGEREEQWDKESLYESLKKNYDYDLDLEAISGKKVFEIEEYIYNELLTKYEEREKEITSDLMRRIEKYIILEVVDSRWRENLQTLDALKEGIHLRAYGQKDPVVEYKILSAEIYDDMVFTIRREVISFLYKVKVKTEEVELKEREEEEVHYNHGEKQEREEKEVKQKPIVNSDKVGRNDSCPCGSGKKYKLCCGK